MRLFNSLNSLTPENGKHANQKQFEVQHPTIIVYEIKDANHVIQKLTRLLNTFQV